MTAHRRVGWWLVACAAMVAVTLTVGGTTRLTRSGLSITEWRPIAGVIPPMSDAAWADALDKYRQTPEYRLVNRGMSLEEFKGIYWWEFWHRIAGRAIGLVFLLPYLYFLVRRAVPSHLHGRLLSLFLLGGLQGALGWFMVASGLVESPMVSPVRLTAHLSLALFLYVALLWTALGLLSPGHPDHAPPPQWRRWAQGLLVLSALMVVTGGLVAGSRAGHVFQTFPLMDGSLVPPGLYALHPWWNNLVLNMGAIQFHHRMAAWLLVLVVALLQTRQHAAPERVRRAIRMIGAAALLQVTIGAFTVITGVPVVLGVLHQFGALGVITAVVWFAHLVRVPTKLTQHLHAPTRHSP
jgi:cytochrome c oxidase assembly protein subunit 15